MFKVLLVGEDFRLLATRAAVLAKIRVSTVCCSAAELRRELKTETFDLVVLCHSLAEETASEMTSLVRERWPEARIMLVTSTVYDDRVYRGVRLDVMTPSDPKKVLQHTLELLGLPLDGSSTERSHLS